MIAEALSTVGVYGPSDIEFFKTEVRFREFERGELILQAGKVASEVYYICSGAVYQYRIVDEIEEMVLDLATAGRWILDQKSFILQQAAETHIKAYQKCQILVLSITSIHKLIGLSPSFFHLLKLVDGGSQRTTFYDRSLSPLEKYATLIRENPAVLKHFPLKMIASYLKVTPETLSRVRKKADY